MIMASIDPRTHLTDYVDTIIYHQNQNSKKPLSCAKKTEDDLLQVNTEIQQPKEKRAGMQKSLQRHFTYPLLRCPTRDSTT